jgi:hypothetical protein
MPKKTGRAHLRTASVVRRTSPALLGAILFCASRAASAPTVSVESQLEQDSVAMDQQLGVRLTVTTSGGGDIQHIELPSSPNLRLTGKSQSEQSLVSFGAGGLKTSHTTVYHLTWQPLHTGELALSPAQVTVGGQVFKGNALRVKVVPAGQGSQPRQQPSSPFGPSSNAFPPGFPQMPSLPDMDSEDPFAQLFSGGPPPDGSEVFLASALDKKEVYLGQQVVYTIRLYTRADVSEFDDLKLPGFDGFWGEELETPTHPRPQLQTVGGTTYQVFLLKKRALFPDRAGTLTVQPAEVDVGVGFGFFRGRKVHRASAPSTLKVLPLPSGAPPGFGSANVGQWRLAATLKPVSVPVGEPATLTLTVDGLGNLHGLSLPSLPEIPGVRAYDPTVTDTTSIQGDRFGGHHQVEIVLIPQRTGDFGIPSLTFSWFDPQLGSYQSATTPSLDLHASVNAAGGAGIGGAGGQNVLESSYRPLRDSPGFLEGCQRAARLSLGSPPEPFLLGAIVAPPAFLSILELVRRLRRRRERAAPQLRGRRAYRLAGKRLQDAQALLDAGDTAPAHDALAAALLGYLEDRAGEPFAGLELPEVALKLAALGVSEGPARATVGALEAQEAARYAPGDGSGPQSQRLFAMTRAALEALEKSGLRRGVKAA